MPRKTTGAKAKRDKPKAEPEPPKETPPLSPAPRPVPQPEKKGEVVPVTLGAKTPVTPRSVPERAPAPPAAPAPPPRSALDLLPAGVTGKRGHPTFGKEALILRLQVDLDNFEQTYYVHDDETIKSVTDASLPEAERLANVKLKATLKASGT